ncbi:VanZ family protein [Candidatus Woesearchaeota archaeon]|nr:VanZ family protein [Candidatus Woesearchaeota archaeon]
MMFSQLIRKKVFYWLLVISYMSLIFYLSSIPSIDIVTKIPINDKILHAAEFFILAALLHMCFNIADNKMINKNRYFLAITITTIYAISDEFHQSFVPGRVADIFDLTADSIGASIILIFKFVNKKYFNISR